MEDRHDYRDEHRHQSVHLAPTSSPYSLELQEARARAQTGKTSRPSDLEVNCHEYRDEIPLESLATGNSWYR